MEEPVPLEQLIAAAERDRILFGEKINKIRNGDAFEMYELPQSYSVYANKEKWEELRKAWLLHAALRDYTEAQYKLALMYRNETPANNQLAMKWFFKASEQGNAEAMLFIGCMYKEGHGVAVDYKLAMEWFVKALPIKPGSANAYIGVLYERGLGVPTDRLKALEHYFKSDNDYLSSTARIRKISAEGNSYKDNKIK